MGEIDMNGALDEMVKAKEQELLEEIDKAMEVTVPPQYKVETSEDLYDMELFDSKMNGGWRITRVPNGWIFENTQRHGYPCFVPRYR